MLTSDLTKPQVSPNSMLVLSLSEPMTTTCAKVGQVIEIHLRNSFSGHRWMPSIPFGTVYLMDGNNNLQDGRTESWFRIRFDHPGCYQVNFEFKQLFAGKADDVLRLAIYVR